MTDYKDRRVLVTGSAGGVGSAIARVFAEAKATVVLTDISEEGLGRVAAQITSGGGRVEVQHGDLGTREGCRDLAARCGPIDVLINNAALTFMKYQGVLVRDDLFWDRTFAVDLFAPITLMQELCPGMVERKRGNVINISSVSASRGTPDLAPYAAAKAALETMSRVAAMELAMRGTRVRVNCIALGLVDTPALARNFPDRATQDEMARRSAPLGRVISPDEVARLALFLASEGAAAILGTVVTIDGGMTAGAYSFAGSFISSDESPKGKSDDRVS
jgi:NAD(P)-dependent dehydrogenase (short-subunit alcohol dehydrogenase family)